MTELGGTKDDGNKPRMDLIPPEPLIGAAKVFAFGAGKYGERNWEKGMTYGRLFAALMRHLWSWWGGQERDDESGKHHLSHAMCCLMMLHALAHRSRGLEPHPYDDRDEGSPLLKGPQPDLT